MRGVVDVEDVESSLRKGFHDALTKTPVDVLVYVCRALTGREEGGREGGEGSRGMEGRREAGREGGREEKREERREGGRERGREERREGGRE